MGRWEYYADMFIKHLLYRLQRLGLCGISIENTIYIYITYELVIYVFIYLYIKSVLS